MARIETQLARRQVRAPIDGVVLRVLKDEGEYVSANDPVVVRLVQLDSLLAEFSIPTSRARSVAVNDSIDVHLPAKGPLQKEAVVSGTVEFVSPTSDAQSETTRVKVRLPNRDGSLHAGQSCRLRWASPAISATGDRSKNVRSPR